MIKSPSIAAWSFLFGFAFLSSAFAASANRTWIPGRVVHITDGDTFTFQPFESAISMRPIKVRMAQIDSPEAAFSGPYGVRAQGDWGALAVEHLERLIRPGDIVEIETLGPVELVGFGNERLTREVLGKVWSDGLDVNLEMLKSGWATLYVYCDGEGECYADPDYIKACNDAMASGQGVFNPMDPMGEPPFAFRARIEQISVLEYVGHREKRFYVEPSRWAEIPLCERMFFISDSVARGEGFTRR